MTDRGVLLPNLFEGLELEAKAAQGRDGRGELPRRTLLETYSAFANTAGGTILLGVKERKDGLYALGLANITPMQKQLWDTLNDPNQVSANVLHSGQVSVERHGDRDVLRINVPRAPRNQRPVYLGRDPFTGTYLRRFEADHLAPREMVGRMLADRGAESRDRRALPGYDLSDLDPDTLKRYRQRFSTTNPDHPWIEVPDEEFLRCLGAGVRDRASHTFSLTLAGVLMFGKLPSILEVLPNYVVDYQEHDGSGEDRWIDRLTTDGHWSGNLYDFYRLVMPRLTRDLKVPFALKGGTDRVDDTPVHEALREALVNALIHADYDAPVAVRVVKRPDGFEFRNPGLLRVPLELALEGGHSDCRNRNLQKMFQLVGLGDHAGSGLPKVIHRWKQQSWQSPELVEHQEPSEHTELSLRMLSLLPAEAVVEVRNRIGDQLDAQDELGRLALVTAAANGLVNHRKLSSLSDAHPADITKRLASLVQDGLLVPYGRTSARQYTLPGAPDPDTLVARILLRAMKDAEAAGELDSPNSPPSSPNSPSDSPNLAPSSPNSDHSGQKPRESELEPEAWDNLWATAAAVRNAGRVDRPRMEDAIIALCQGRWLTLDELRVLVGREAETVRSQYLRPLATRGLLRFRYPDQRNHPRQAYTAANSGDPTA